MQQDAVSWNKVEKKKISIVQSKFTTYSINVGFYCYN